METKKTIKISYDFPRYLNPKQAGYVHIHADDLDITLDMDNRGILGVEAADDYDVTDAHVDRALSLLDSEQGRLISQMGAIDDEINELKITRDILSRKISLVRAILGRDG